MNPEQRLHSLQRRFEADPLDVAAWQEWMLLRSRLEGSKVFLEPLINRDTWNATPVNVQDLAINEVQRCLGDAYSKESVQVFQCQSISHRIAVFRHIKSSLLLHLIPGGPFQMGTARGKEPSFEDEFPLHQVTIRKALLVARYPVTQSQWMRCQSSNPSEFKGPERPVETVSWFDVQSWLDIAGDGLRLLSEAEWEYACRAGADTRFFWGEEFDGRYSWNADNSNETSIVTEHESWHNAFGLVDFLGLVDEWCADDWISHYKEGPYDEQARRDPESGRYIVRGGTWGNSSMYLRCASRDWWNPETKDNDLGFRVACSIPQKPS